MPKSKFCYIIVNKENGNMLVEDDKLPIYWNKNTAEESKDKYDRPEYVVHRLSLDDIENLILRSKRA